MDKASSYQSRSHFTDPDYSLTVSDRLGRVAAHLKYIDESGAIKRVMPTWSFHTDAGKATAMKEARKERDRLLALPEFQAYIALKYADPTGTKKNYAKPRAASTTGTIPNLTGIFVQIQSRHLHESVSYMNIYAHGPGGKGKTKYRTWSVKKYGLNLALEKAAQWRAEYVGEKMPSPRELAAAESAVRKTYRAYLSGQG